MGDYLVNVDRKQFVEDYHNGMKPAKIQKKYCLSPRQYRVLIRSFDRLTRTSVGGMYGKKSKNRSTRKVLRRK